MRIVGLVVILLLLTGASAVPSAANRSEAWFRSLSDEQRTTLQLGLILTGDYSNLVDGVFGPATYKALLRFQAKSGDQRTGVLSERAIGALGIQAQASFDRLGMRAVADDRSGFATFVPKALLTKEQTTDLGMIYSTDDGLLTFEVMGFAVGATTLAALYDVLTIPEPGEVITYRFLGANYAVVTGTAGYWRHYTLFMESGDQIAGYSVNWTDQYSDVANIAAVFAASYSLPLSLTNPNRPAPPSSHVDAFPIATFDIQGTRLGSFLLPLGSPEVVILDGEIGDAADADFERVLTIRPDARFLVLNSVGGSVGSALAVARLTADHSLNTYIPKEAGCYSACAYVFFAGSSRRADGALGVHQMYGGDGGMGSVQYALSYVLDLLGEFDVPQQVISLMLRTPADDMYVFSPQEIAELGIDREAGHTTASLASAERPESSFVTLR